MTTVEKLRKMRGLLARPNGWIQHANARNAAGKVVHFASPMATCYCLIGASIAVNSDPAAEDALRAFLGDSIIVWNDRYGRTQAEVLAAIDGTIEALS